MYLIAVLGFSEMSLVCIVLHAALTPVLRGMICYGLGTEKPEPGKSGRWMGMGERGSFSLHPSSKTFFFPSQASWHSVTSSGRPFPIALQVPSDPLLQRLEPLLHGALTIHPMRTHPEGANISWNIYWTAPLPQCPSESPKGFVKTRCSAPEFPV